MRKAGGGRTIALAATLAGAVVLVAVASLAWRPAANAATGDDRIVATLQTAGRAHSPDLRARLAAMRAEPGNRALAKAAARALIDEGRAQGDSRLVGAAIGVLRGFADTPDAEALYIEATARQYQHDFDGAVQLLDRAVALDPGGVNPILSRAFIRTVLGRFDLAEADCRRIAATGQAEVAFLCQSTALLLTGQRPQIARRLEQAVAVPGRMDPALIPWATGLLGEIAMLDGQDEAAMRLLRQVIAADPGLVRERLLLADVLLRQGAAAEVPPLLEAAPEIDGVLVRRALAGRMLDRPDAEATAELARRVQLALDLELKAHAREEAMYFLLLADDPQMALARAKVNWDLQHEIEDAQLLIDAAVAAGRPGEAAPVLAWIDEQGVTVPTLRIPQAVRDAAR